MDDIQISDFKVDIGLDLEFNLDDFTLDESKEPPSKWIKPRFSKNPIYVHYKNAKKLAKEIKLAFGDEVNCTVSGDFIFGDFIEAFIYENKYIVKNLEISTLSMSQDNIDSFKNLLELGWVENLVLILSNYFYSHERNGLMVYLFDTLPLDKVDIRIARIHTKITLIELEKARIIITGSANLRSSKTVEQFRIEENPQLWQFYKEFHARFENKSIIKREV